MRHKFSKSMQNHTSKEASAHRETTFLLCAHVAKHTQTPTRRTQAVLQLWAYLFLWSLGIQTCTYYGHCVPLSYRASSINACVHLQTPASMAGVRLHNHTYMNTRVTYSYIQTPARTCVYPHTHIQTPARTCVYAHTHTHTHKHYHGHACTLTHTYKHQHVQGHTKYNFRNIIINCIPFTSPRLTKDNIYIYKHWWQKQKQNTWKVCAHLRMAPNYFKSDQKMFPDKTLITNTWY